MPNWCENELTVSGPAEELEKFRAFATPLIAEQFYPEPDCPIDKLCDMLVYRFDTKYAPPTGFIDEMAKMYPSLLFLYSYGGVEVQFFGSIYFLDGYRRLWNGTGYTQNLWEDDVPLNKEFQRALHKKFPDFVVDPERVANE